MSEFFLLRGSRFERIGWHFGYSLGPVVQRVVGAPDGAIDELRWWGGPRTNLLEVETLAGPRSRVRSRDGWTAWAGLRTWGGTTLAVTQGVITPDDFDFPLTRKALRGQERFRGMKFAVTRDGGERFLVGMGGDFALARELAAHVEKNVAGAKPRIVCAEPQVIRELDVDLATGELRKGK